MPKVVQWFFAKVGYLTTLSLDEDCGVVQEDLFLLTAENAEAAYSKATALGKSVAAFGQGLLEGGEDGPIELGLGKIGETSRAPNEDAESTPNLVHPSLRNTYREFFFLGLRELGALHGPPTHGLEIESREIAMGEEDLASIRSCAEETFSAFSPSGPAFSEHARRVRNSNLYKEHKWYLAEQVFEISPEQIDKQAGTNAVERLVLINAEGPHEAVEKARSERPQAWTQPIHFSGLRDVFLIESDLIDGCELRSLLLEMPILRVQTYTREKSLLAAFATTTSGAASS